LIWAALLVFQFAALPSGLWLDVPFVHQEKNGCGSASVWMVMQYWKHPATPRVEDIHHELYSKQAQGIYARDMERYLDQHGFRTFTFQAGWDDISAHLSKGRPLIVCLERNARGVPLHYVVLAGVDPEQDLVWINDPAERKLVPMRRAEFEAAWKGTGNWTLLALPDQDPIDVAAAPRAAAVLDPTELELASTSFRAKDLPETERHLKSFLREAPEDPFANDFLGTTYLLDGNLDAALKYWNRAGKPTLRDIHTDPPLQIDPLLLDRTFAFSRAGELQADEYYKTRARLDSLGVFTRYRFDLTPTDADSFDMTLRATERTGPDWLSWLGGLPYQTMYPGWWNIRHRAINIESLVRWDPEKRRGSLSVAWPGPMNSSLRYRIHSDARDENWQLPTATFKLRRTEFGGSVDAVLNDTWTWRNTAAITRRSFSTAFTTGFEGGTALSYSTALRHVLLRIPERQFTIDSGLSAQVGKLFTEASGRFLKTEGDVGLRWQDFSTRLRSGKTFGSTPFDELFVLGVDRDSDLRLRGHPATISGRKGAAPVVPGYILLNNDFERLVVNKTFVKLRVGPFIDTARVSSQSAWLIDSGLQLKLGILSAFTFTASAGWNVHGGSHAIFIESAR
jgi:predicted double-glycine peptidase